MNDSTRLQQFARNCSAVCVVTRKAVRHDCMKSRREIASPVEVCYTGEFLSTDGLQQLSLRPAVVLLWHRRTDRQGGIFAIKHASILQDHFQRQFFFVMVYTLNNARVGVVWRSTRVGCPVNRYVNRKSIFLYLGRFVVVLCCRMEGQDIEMAAGLFLSLRQYSQAQGRY